MSLQKTQPLVFLNEKPCFFYVVARSPLIPLEFTCNISHIREGSIILSPLRSPIQDILGYKHLKISTVLPGKQILTIIKKQKRAKNVQFYKQFFNSPLFPPKVLKELFW